MAEPSVASKITAEEAALYDRQIRLWGLEAQNRLKNSSVLIIGLSGPGPELAKNLMLAGLKSLTLLDDQMVSEYDLKINCLLDRSKALHKKRAEAVAPRCQQLNPLVSLKTITVPTKEIMEKAKQLMASDGFDLVCCIDRYIDELIMINKACRESSTMFLMGGVFGWYGYAFIDFGVDFEYACEVLAPLPGPKGDTNAPMEDTIIDDEEEDITVEDQPEAKKAKLDVQVEVSDVEIEKADSEGAAGDDGGDTVPKNAPQGPMEIGATTAKKEREKVIVRKVMSFVGLEESLLSPRFPETGSGSTAVKRKRAKPPYPVGYYLFQMTAGFYHEYKRVPRMSSKLEDIRAMALEKNAVLNQLADVKVDLPDDFAISLFDQMPAVCAIIGGVLGQEAIKAVSRKDEPINNWFFYNPYDSSGLLAKIPRG